MMKQTSFGFFKNYKKEFGGSLLLGKRKERRPLSTKHPIHLVLKSSAKGVFNPGNRKLEKLIRANAKDFGIKIYDQALNWSHIHLLIRIPSREQYVRFIRALTSKLKAPFTLRPFTRILSWGRDFHNALSYFTLNQMEAVGMNFRCSELKETGISQAARSAGAGCP